MKTLLLFDPTMLLALIPIALLVLLIIMKKREITRANEAADKVVESLRPGLRVKTVGGCIGRIKKISDENGGVLRTVLLQTGNDKNPGYVLFDAKAVLGILEEAMTQNDVEEKEASAQKPSEEMDAASYIEQSNKARGIESSAAQSSGRKKK